MNGVHTNLIIDAKTLATDILSTSNDSIEKELSRNVSNELSRNVNSTVATLLLTLFGVPGPVYLFAARIDKEKLKKIESKLINLKTTALDETSPDYTKALCARDFQEKVYENVVNYTRTARKIKNITGACFILWPAIMYTTLIKDCLQGNRSDLKFVFMSFPALLAGTIGATYGFYHRLSEGTKLDDTKRALSKQALIQLNA